MKRTPEQCGLNHRTHKRLEEVSDGTSTQVVACMINKCRIKMVQMELYNVRDPQWKGKEKFVKESTLTVRAIYVTIFHQYIQEHTSSDYVKDKFT